MKEQRIVYLAIPYSWNPEFSYKAANIIASRLMAEGCVVFSPISHSHAIANYLPEELRTDSMWWMKQDLAMMQNCTEICVVLFLDYDGIKLIKESTGVQNEIEFAEKLELNKTFYVYE